MKSSLSEEEFILSIPKFTKKNSLEETTAFYEYLGRPGEESTIIHVAGTNGKGSVCAYMDACLRAGGYSVGMFTSPHLVSMRERIRLDKREISEGDFVCIMERLRESLEIYRKKNPRYHPSFFEWLFLMNMLYMEEKKPQVLLLETGLGGRLDSTNVIQHPRVCVITPVGMDHMEYLGNNLAAIAGEKAGIIKPGSRIVYAAMEPESEAVIEKRAGQLGCSCIRVSKEGETGFDSKNKRIDFSFYSRYYGYVPLTVYNTALYQVDNVRLALTALEESGLRLSEEDLKKGVRDCRWEGRMEEILPEVFLDGAHNREGIDAFLKSVEWDGCTGKRWLLFAAVEEKEVEIMVEKIEASGLFQKIYTTGLQVERGVDPHSLKRLFRCQPAESGDEASCMLKKILELRAKEDRIYIAGSLYLAGEIKTWLLTANEEVQGE